MADRYWVGGTGNWNNTAMWSASSGGPSGASVPTSADNVFFDANSDGAPNVAFTVTVNVTSSCADIDIGVTSALTQTMTLAGSSTLNVFGSWKNATSATYTRTFTGSISFLATTTGKVITTNGVTLTTGGINFNGAGGGWTLGSALTVGPASGAGAITVLQGTFDTDSTGNYSVTTSALLSTGTGTRTINLNGSTVTLNFEGVGLNLSGSNITFNAGTSQINHTAFTPTIIVGGFTLYNFSFTSTIASNANLSLSNGSATFNNLTVTSPTAESTGIRTLQVTGNNVTINGTLTLGSANTVVRRVQVFSDIMGTQRTITFNGASSALATLSNVDFRDVVFATSGGSPVALPASGTKLGDGGNNSQITFAAGTNCYWTGNTSGSVSDNRWSNLSGGSPSTSFFPLAQDTLIFDQSGTPANHTVTNNRNFWFGALDFSARSTAITFATGTTSIVLFKALTLSSAVTLTGTTGAFSFQQGAGAQTIDITPAGVAFTQNIVVNVNPTSSVRLLGNITNSNTSLSVTLTSGTLNLNGNTLSYGLFAGAGGTGSGVREVNFGTNGTFTISGSGATAWSASGSNFSTSGTGTISLTSASAKTFAGGGFTYTSALNQGGAGTLTISGSNTFANITNTYGATGATTITFTAGTTQTVSAFTASGTSGKLLTLNSSSAGTRFNLSDPVGFVNVSFCDIKDSSATGGARWLAYLANGNVDSGNNAGWRFSQGEGLNVISGLSGTRGLSIGVGLVGNL